MNAPYVGRFAPSPTGPLHAGSLVAALASWLDARAHGGRWLVRIEDVDTPRCPPGVASLILSQLQAFNLIPDAPPVYQSMRHARYAAALARLVGDGRAYPCACTRAEIHAAMSAAGKTHASNTEWVYPGTCRPERGGLHGRSARAWRFHLPTDALLTWSDRRIGTRTQDAAQAVGDFVLKRADGLWAYQLAVVVDDADQGVTDVVRGEDLLDNTPRQMLLADALGVPRLRYLHVPLVRQADGEKLSKQHGAPPLDTRSPLKTLEAAARFLGLPPAPAGGVAEALSAWTLAWPSRP